MKVFKKLLVITMTALMLLSLTACSPELKMVGRWNIVSVDTGDMTIEAGEFEEYGLKDPGYVRLNKSGSCILNLLGDEYEGEWELDNNGEVDVIYSDKMKGHAVRDGKKMTFVDGNGNEYKLEK